ncbi:MAG: hypothetical protein O6766_05035 [Gammaproteobacteria bacterium]|nr:hypothetical protein [Gammaproteobacteria bacterium]
MRFILGILIGAALTLFAATAVDAPTNPLFDKVVNLWDAIIETTSEALFENTAFNPPPDTSPNISPNTARENTAAETPESPFAIAADAESPFAFAAGAESPFAFAAGAIEVLVEKLPRSVAAVEDVALPKRLTSQENAEEESNVNVVSESPEQIPEPVPHESAPVWVSFHSQMSAEGFARQLSDQFHHPFAVARQGPGDYQVMFDYGSIDERDALLDEIAAVTGYRAP